MPIVMLPGDSTDTLFTAGGIQAQSSLQSNTSFILQGSYNGQGRIKTVVGETGALSGASGSITGLIPAGSLVFGVISRVTVLAVGPTQFLIGYSGDTNAWGNNIAVAAGTTTTFADFTSGTASPLYFASATDVVITKVTTDFSAGKVRCMVIYMDAQALQG